MTDREKVIKGLNCCQECDDNTCRNCCPYHDRNEPKNKTACVCRLTHDALALINEQKPRVLTLEELLAIGDVWEYNTPPYLWIDVNPNIRLTNGFWVAWRDIRDMVHGLHPKYTDENYGTDWRCWTARPTDLQREAIPWE